LDEPILTAELERAKREGNAVAGKAFLITPDDLTKIQQEAYKSKGIMHIKGTLADFVSWLAKQFPTGLSPRDIVRKESNYSNEDLASLSEDDLEAAQSLVSVRPDYLKAHFRQLADADKALRARQFLRGFPPTLADKCIQYPCPTCCDGRSLCRA
jgi:hypothetical protein